MKYNANTKFPISWKDTLPDGTVASFIAQPYLSGLYMSITVAGRMMTQTVLSYTQSASLLKRLCKDPEVTDLIVGTLGQFLDESKLEILNG